MATGALAAKEPEVLDCDYLVVGAGATGMSFVDTLLTESKDTTVVLVDKLASPGGHWHHAYPFVKLHQPAGLYGVASEPMGLVVGAREPLDTADLQSKDGLLSYYAKVLEKFVSSGRVRFFGNATYDETNGTLTSDERTYTVRCVKTVRTLSNVAVPSTTPPKFSVASGVNFKPVNDLMDAPADGSYVVLGAGKTGVDALLHLLSRGVQLEKISWVVPRDAWYWLRDRMFVGGNALKMYSTLMKVLVKSPSLAEAYLELERLGFMGRLDSDIMPTVMKDATITSDELILLRTVKNVVRLGRVSAIESAAINLASGELPLASDVWVVDCTASAVGQQAAETVWGGNAISIPTLGPPGFCFSAALVAFIETKFADDAVKNSLLPKEVIPTTFDPSALVHQLYASMKVMNDLMAKCKPAMNFLMNCRLGPNAPCHVHWTKLLWYMLGPGQMMLNMPRLQKKIERGGFKDVPAKVKNAPGSKKKPANQEVHAVPPTHTTGDASRA
jgi:hypothetical protein